MMKAHIAVVDLGSCIIERNGKEFLVMFADGTVQPFGDYSLAINTLPVIHLRMLSASVK